MLNFNNDQLLSKVCYLEKFDNTSDQEVLRGKRCTGRIFFEELENDDLESFTNKILYIGKNILKQYGSTIENNLNEIKKNSNNIFEEIKQKGNYNIEFSAITKNNEEVPFNLIIQTKQEFNNELNELSNSITKYLPSIEDSFNKNIINRIQDIDYLFFCANVQILELLDESACKKLLNNEYDRIKKQILFEKINNILWTILIKLDNSFANFNTIDPNFSMNPISYSITAITGKDNARKLYLMPAKEREDLKKRSVDLKDLDPAIYHRIFSMKCFTSKK